MDITYRHTCKEKINLSVSQVRITIDKHRVFLYSHSMHILACRHLITLVVQVGELRLCSKVKGDFFLDVPEMQMQISH